MASSLNSTLDWRSFDNDFNFTVSNFSNVSTTSDDSLTKGEPRMNTDFMKYYMWLFFGFGLPANVLTIVTILKFQFGGPASFLLCFLAGIDNVALVAKLIESNLMYTNLIATRSSFFCKTIVLPGALFAAISNWTLILICAERYVSVCKPLKRKIWISNKRCKVAVSLVSIFLTIVYATLFLIFVDVNSQNKCGVIYFSSYSFALLQFVIVIAIPFVLITILTILVIRALYVARGNRKKMLTKSEKGQSRNTNKRHFQDIVSKAKSTEETLSCLMMSSAILFFAISLPFCVFHFGYLPFHDWNRESIHVNTVIITIHDIFFVLMDASHLLNVFVYFIFVSKFRVDVCKLLKSIC